MSEPPASSVVEDPRASEVPEVEAVEDDGDFFRAWAPGSIPEIDVELGHAKSIIWGFPKMVGFPNNHGVCFPTKNHHFGVFLALGVPPFKETRIYHQLYISEFIHE